MSAMIVADNIRQAVEGLANEIARRVDMHSSNDADARATMHEVVRSQSQKVLLDYLLGNFNPTQLKP